MFPQENNEIFVKEARTWRSSVGTQPCFWPLTPPSPPTHPPASYQPPTQQRPGPSGIHAHGLPHPESQSDMCGACKTGSVGWMGCQGGDSPESLSSGASTAPRAHPCVEPTSGHVMQQKMEDAEWAELYSGHAVSPTALVHQTGSSSAVPTRLTTKNRLTDSQPRENGNSLLRLRDGGVFTGRNGELRSQGKEIPSFESNLNIHPFVRPADRLSFRRWGANSFLYALCLLRVQECVCSTQ